MNKKIRLNKLKDKLSFPFVTTYGTVLNVCKGAMTVSVSELKNIGSNL